MPRSCLIIRSSLSSSGYPREMCIIKRSSCADGSGYVPDVSTGFCVARTKKVSSVFRVVPFWVTCFSAIASRRAD